MSESVYFASVYFLIPIDCSSGGLLKDPCLNVAGITHPLLIEEREVSWFIRRLPTRSRARGNKYSCKDPSFAEIADLLSNDHVQKGNKRNIKQNRACPFRRRHCTVNFYYFFLGGGGGIGYDRCDITLYARWSSGGADKLRFRGKGNKGTWRNIRRTPRFEPVIFHSVIGCLTNWGNLAFVLLRL